MTKPAAEVLTLANENAATHVHDLEAHMHLLRQVDVIRKKSATLRTDGLTALFRLTEEAKPKKSDLKEDGAASGQADESNSNDSSMATGAADGKVGVDENGQVFIKPRTVNISGRGKDLLATYKQLRVKWQYSGQKPEARPEIRDAIARLHKDFSLKVSMTSVSSKGWPP
jgi:hypothetical protein